MIPSENIQPFLWQWNLMWFLPLIIAISTKLWSKGDNSNRKHKNTEKHTHKAATNTCKAHLSYLIKQNNFSKRWNSSSTCSTKVEHCNVTQNNQNPGPGCSKLMTSLVNVSLKFQTLISEIVQYFLLKKCEKLLQCKSFSHFFSKKFQCIWLWSRKTLNELIT